MAERTPGPWQIMEGTDWVIISPEVSVAAVYTPRGDREVRQANAYFIAAAPDMEKALEMYIQAEDSEIPSVEEFAWAGDAARAALAKARGES